MTRRLILTMLLAVVSVSATLASDIFSNLSYQMRIGYNLGGTSPIGLPAEIRSLDKFKPKSNLLLGVDAYKPLRGNWGLSAGLTYENKGMETDAKVKNYHMSMRRGGDVLSGRFTGNVVTDVEMAMVTLPVRAVYNISHRVRLMAGPYVSYVTSGKFSGYAYDGYLRDGSPVGQKVEMGHDEGERGEYDFSDDLRSWQFGVDVGADWYITKRFGVYVGLKWGVTPIFRSSFKTIEQKLYPLYGSAGIVYKFR